VHTHIGAYHILHGVDFAVPEGRGDDAAGPQRRRQDHHAAHDHGPVAGQRKGELSFRGQRMNGLATPDIAGQGIAYVPESMGIFTDLTVKENMVLAARRRATKASWTARGWTGSSASSRR
jgi:branched-chain amino acid transport system ATP-binding protein